MEEKRLLEITLVKLQDHFVDVQIYEPETGDWNRKIVPFSPDEHPELNEWIGNEIYEWITYMMEEDES